MNLRRKRLRLMRDTQWRGYARTAEGNPITLSQIRSVATLSVLGNSSQEGTPSPDNPVDVIGTGIASKNLIHQDSVSATQSINNTDKSWYNAFNSAKGILTFGCFIENPSGNPVARARLSVGKNVDGKAVYDYIYTNNINPGQSGWSISKIAIPDTYNGLLNFQPI